MPKGTSVLVLNQRVRNFTATKAATIAHNAPTRVWLRTPSPSVPINWGSL